MISSWARGKDCLVVKAIEGALVENVVRSLGAAAFSVEAQGSAAAAARIGHKHYSLVVIAIDSAFNEHELVRLCRAQSPEMPVLVLGKTVDTVAAVEALRAGAADYGALGEESRTVLGRVRKIILGDDRPRADAANERTAPDFLGLIGTSPPIRRVFNTIEKISRYKTTVLLLGESGTGKELIARALHARGPRRDHLFVPINCATLGKDLLENELFGHERGAYTGADDRKKGLFELADGGTLFLDEIAEMDTSTQAKLLRVLERNEFRRVGGTSKIRVDLSVIAATNRNLHEAVEAGRFREDLYYRLKVVTVSVPPLRERKEDLPALVQFFISDFNRRNGGKIRSVAPDILTALMRYDWPGNVRELKHTIESAAVLAAGETITGDVFDEVITLVRKNDQVRERVSASAGPRVDRTIDRTVPDADDVYLPVGTSLVEAERLLIEATLRKHPVKARAAKVLGIGLRTLFVKLREYEQASAQKSPEAAEDSVH
ncbi:MAG: sigma-54-dependent Fis family transcriptional regulator [Deltaproteobacteria bacterium]|nr:sigma-54-dependent Fis family transcriptional regulator [Deltaproteobacteria bacterium]